MRTYQILLVEDDRPTQHITKMMLNKLDCEVMIVSSVKEAKLLANTQPFSLIVLDIGLPDGDGWEIINHQQDHPKGINTNTPILVVTAHYHPKFNTTDCNTDKLLGIIEKPLPPAKLHEVVNQLIPYGYLLLFDYVQAEAVHHDFTVALQTFKQFQADLINAQENIHHAYQACDWPTLQHHVHKLHGAALYAGTARLNACLQDMETLLRAQPIATDKVRQCHHHLAAIIQATINHQQEKAAWKILLYCNAAATALVLTLTATIAFASPVIVVNPVTFHGTEQEKVAVVTYIRAHTEQTYCQSVVCTSVNQASP